MVEEMIKKNEEALHEVQKEVWAMVDKIRRSNEKLAEIVLRPNPLSDIDYIQLLIETEKMEHREGWQNRVKHYTNILNRETLFRTIQEPEHANLFQKLVRTPPKPSKIWKLLHSGRKHVGDAFNYAAIRGQMPVTLM